MILAYHPFLFCEIISGDDQFHSDDSDSDPDDEDVGSDTGSANEDAGFHSIWMNPGFQSEYPVGPLQQCDILNFSRDTEGQNFPQTKYFLK